MENDTKEINQQAEVLIFNLLTREEAKKLEITPCGLSVSRGLFLDWLYSHDYVIGRKT